MPARPADLLAEVYALVTDVVRDPASWHKPTRTAWQVHELLLHLLGDARRALVTLNTPADALPDVDRVSYWRDFRPDGTEGSDVPAVRTLAAHTSPAGLVDEWTSTSAAASHACRVAEPDLVATQGHVLTVDDFVHTLLLEATVHYLDLTVALDAPPPPAGALAEVRRVLEALFGGPLPGTWDDTECVLKATGRVEPSVADRELLGPRAGALPLLG